MSGYPAQAAPLVCLSVLPEFADYVQNIALEVYRMAVHVFHKASIGGLQFEAFILDSEPRISCRDPYRNQCRSLALGVSYLRFFSPDFPSTGEEGWWFAKYGQDALIDLTKLSQVQVLELAHEFGLPFWVAPFGSDDFYCMAAFYHGKAWDGLKSWVHAHPRIAQKLSLGTAYYLPCWYYIAVGLRPIFEVKPNSERDEYLAQLGRHGSTFYIPQHLEPVPVQTPNGSQD
ncbi:hypothetical protein [Pseudomonas kielensis]|uniref:Uncharacterized protein n=3 Tax=Pseudomonas TaxID=286 RepID=A0A7X1L115_9PSED|nr:hypothetical protein [Pseudomonas kielensis]MBC2693521.1 hypothetical protein [Pseudomonas kielensis]